ncbi:MAG: TlyA family rRNA (cytidine-2'-O)-methyltransferase, partial [Microcystaceae cyanobacterium]
NPEDRAIAIYQVGLAAQKQGWQAMGVTASPLPGPAGNIEYLLGLTLENTAFTLDLEALKKMVRPPLEEQP